MNWPSPPRNILLTKKDCAPDVTESFIEYAKHIHSSYPSVSIVLEPSAVQEVHQALPFPVYTNLSGGASLLPGKIDLVSTLGGDGTILRASSLFASALTVPPILSFSMGTLGFLGEWKFKEYKRAFREVYMSGAEGNHGDILRSTHTSTVESSVAEAGESTTTENSGLGYTTTIQSSSKSPPLGWSTIRGKLMGASRAARVLLRNRLKVGVFTPNGQRVASSNKSPSSQGDVYAMNEVIIHRGRDPHLAIVEVFVGGRFLTEAVADGMIISTPTGSTAYSLSSGGSIVHPLVASLLLTPICPRSLSFRPLVLPANTPITLRLSEKNRGREVDISIDGMRSAQGLGVGMELRVSGEDVKDANGNWVGGVPSVVRGTADVDAGGEDSWVGGLNSLLKFNHPFGEES